MSRIYRDGTTSVGPQCGECGHPARWRIDWSGTRIGHAHACGQHIAKLAPRDQDGILLTPITPQRRKTNS